MANEIKLPEETLMKLGFRLLDICYGVLTIKKGGSNWDEVFINKGGFMKLGYVKSDWKKQSYLAYSFKDRIFFLSIIPVEVVDYERVLKAWFEERYKRKVTVAYASPANSINQP